MLLLLLACADPPVTHDPPHEPYGVIRFPPRSPGALISQGGGEAWRGCGQSFDPARDRHPVGLDEPLPDVGLTARQLLAMYSGAVDTAWYTRIHAHYSSGLEYLDPETLLLEISVGALWWVTPAPPVLPDHLAWQRRHGCPGGWLDTEDVTIRWRELGTGQIVAEATARNPQIPEVDVPLHDSGPELLSVMPSGEQLGTMAWSLDAQVARWGGRCVSTSRDAFSSREAYMQTASVWDVTLDGAVPEALRAELPPTPPGWTGTWVCNTTLFGPPSEPGPRVHSRW